MNEYGNDGWKFSFTLQFNRNEGSTCHLIVMEKEIEG